MRERCVICFETVEGNRRQYSVCNCHVMIHPYCLTQWDKSQERPHTCPLCRRASPSEAKEVGDNPVIVTKKVAPPKQKVQSQPQPSAPPMIPVTYRETSPVDYADAYQSVVYIPIPVYMDSAHSQCNHHRTISLPSVRCPTIQPCTGEVKKNRCAIFGIGILLALLIIYIVVITG